jgi:hypothetical protein
MKSRSQSLVDFFQKRSSTGWRGGGRERSFGNLSVTEVHQILQHLVEDVEPIEDLVKFVKGHSKVARELTLEEVQAAYNILQTDSVLKA